MVRANRIHVILLVALLATASAVASYEYLKWEEVQSELARTNAELASLSSTFTRLTTEFTRLNESFNQVRNDYARLARNYSQLLLEYEAVTKRHNLLTSLLGYGYVPPKTVFAFQNRTSLSIPFQIVEGSPIHMVAGTDGTLYFTRNGEQYDGFLSVWNPSQKFLSVMRVQGGSVQMLVLDPYDRLYYVARRQVRIQDDPSLINVTDAIYLVFKGSHVVQPVWNTSFQLKEVTVDKPSGPERTFTSYGTSIKSLTFDPDGKPYLWLANYEGNQSSLSILTLDRNNQPLPIWSGLQTASVDREVSYAAISAGQIYFVVAENNPELAARLGRWYGVNPYVDTAYRLDSKGLTTLWTYADATLGGFGNQLVDSAGTLYFLTTEFVARANTPARTMLRVMEIRPSVVLPHPILETTLDDWVTVRLLRVAEPGMILFATVSTTGTVTNLQLIQDPSQLATLYKWSMPLFPLIVDRRGSVYLGVQSEGILQVLTKT